MKILPNRSKTTEDNAYVDRKFATRICLVRGRPGKVTTKKRKTRKAPGALDPAFVRSPLGVQNILLPHKIQAQVVEIFGVGDL